MILIQDVLCPSCGNHTLSVNNEHQLVCTALECKDPGAARNMLHEPLVSMNRQLTSRFHIHADLRTAKISVIKTSNGQEVPEEEPLVLLRARDRLAIPTLEAYGKIVVETEYSDPIAKEEHLLSNKATIAKFRAFAEKYPERMKLPNITRGK